MVLLEKNTSYWDVTKDMDVKDDLNASLWMLE
jgi:hypothetical protein